MNGKAQKSPFDDLGLEGSTAPIPKNQVQEGASRTQGIQLSTGTTRRCNACENQDGKDDKIVFRSRRTQWHKKAAPGGRGRE